MTRRFTTHRAAALAVLQSGSPMHRRAGQFLGQIAVDERPLSEKQAAWLGKLLDKAGLPALDGEAGQ